MRIVVLILRIYCIVYALVRLVVRVGIGRVGIGCDLLLVCVVRIWVYRSVGIVALL